MAVPPVDEAGLEAAILAAHAAYDKAGADPESVQGVRLALLYFQAANLKADLGEPDAAAFLMTQAYVFALEAGDPLATKAHAYLREQGREA